MFKIVKLQRGHMVKLTKGDIAQVQISLIDAKRHLTKEQYKSVFNLYDRYKQDKTYELMDLRRYNEIASEIIEQFNQIAPWHLYNGKR